MAIDSWWWLLMINQWWSMMINWVAMRFHWWFFYFLLMLKPRVSPTAKVLLQTTDHIYQWVGSPQEDRGNQWSAKATMLSWDATAFHGTWPFTTSATCWPSGLLQQWSVSPLSWVPVANTCSGKHPRSCCRTWKVWMGQWLLIWMFKVLETCPRLSKGRAKIPNSELINKSDWAVGLMINLGLS